MAKVTLKINGQEVEVEKGATILQAAKQIGVYIPTLCYHPNLPLEEACRLCVVEDVKSGWSTLVAGCVFPARNGMVIETDSEMVNDARRTILDLLLSDHPNDCMTCYAAGNCELQDCAHLYKMKCTSYQGESHAYPVDYDSNPILHLDMNKCILCRRCIRACHDVQGADVWTKVGRGFHQKISTAFEQALEQAGCENCGHCADFCPVDAIGFRAGRGELRSWQLDKGSTVCLLCASGCRALYETKDDKVVRVRGDMDSSVTAGALCKTGRFKFDFANSPDRVRSAAVRNAQGELASVPLAEGLNAAAAGLQKVKDTSGGAAIGVICGGMLTNEEYYLAQKLARGALGTNSVDNVSGPWQQAVYEGLVNAVGFGAMTNPMDDIAQAGAVLVLGSNTMEKHAIAALRARKAAREGAPLIVAHPDQVALTKTATLHLPLKAGSEEALVVGLMKVIVAEDLYDKAYVEANTLDFAKLRKSLEKVSLAEVAEKTGLSEESITEAARQYASRSPACLVYGIEPSTSPTTEAFYRTCGALQMLLGAIGVVGGGANILGASGNAQGAADFGAVAKYLPGYRPASAASSRKAVAKVWGVEPADKAGMNWPEIIAAIEKGSVKALYLIGVDPFDLGLDAGRVQSALAKLELLIVEDCVKNAAFDSAHVVLPAATPLQKSGTATNCERRLQALEAVMPTVGDETSDFDLINGILSILTPQLKVEGLAGAFAEASQLIAEIAGLCACKLGAKGIQWPLDESGAGTERLGVPAEGKAKFRFFSARL